MQNELPMEKMKIDNDLNLGTTKYIRICSQVELYICVRLCCPMPRFNQKIFIRDFKSLKMVVQSETQNTYSNSGRKLFFRTPKKTIKTLEV